MFTDFTAVEGTIALDAYFDQFALGVRIVEPILDAMGIDRLLIETPDDVGLLAPAIARAYETSRPLAALIGRSVEP